MIIQYRIKLRIYDNCLSDYVSYEKDFTSELPSFQEIAGSSVLVKNDYILNYFKEELNASYENWNNIEIDEFEVESLSKAITVYFEAVDDSLEFSLSPNLMCFVEEEFKEIEHPVLQCELLSYNSIRWYWEDKGYQAVLLDDKHKIVGQTGLGVFEWIETDLEEEAFYSRFLCFYDETGSSGHSEKRTIKTDVKYINTDDLYNYSESFDYSHIDKEVEIINERLDAFKTGVGYGDDLKVKKMPIDESMSYGNVNCILKGYGEKAIDVYLKTAFKFRYTLTAKYDVEVVKGNITVSAISGEVQNVKVRAYCYEMFAMDVEYKVSAKIAYLVKSGSGYTPKVRLIEHIGTYNLTNHPANVEIGDDGYPRVHSYWYKVEDRTLKQIIEAEAKKIGEIAASYSDPKVSSLIEICDYKVSDTYSYDAAEYYLDNPNHYMSDGEFSIRANTNHNPQPNSLLYAAGRPSAQLYVKELIKELKVGGEGVVFAPNELNGTLRCFMYPSMTKTATSNCRIYTEILKGEGVEVDVVNGSVVATATNGSVNGPRVSKTFDLENRARIFSFDELVPGYDSSKVNVVTITVNAVDGEVYYSNGDKPKVGSKYSMEVAGAGSFVFECKETVETRDYTEHYPPKNEEPLFGVVNFDPVLEEGENGKRTVFYKSYEFPLESRYYDRKVTVSVEDKTPSSSDLQYNFLSTNANYTEIMGDVVTFSSNSTTSKMIPVEGIIARKKIPVYFNSSDVMALSTTFDVPSSFLSKYLTAKCFIEPDNKSLVPNPDELNVPLSSSVDVAFKVEGVIHPYAPWHIGIHNGYYYMNQHEYFLYANGKPQTDGRKKEIIKYTDTIYGESYTESKAITSGYSSFNVVIKDKSGNIYKEHYQFKIKLDTTEHVLVEDFEVLVDELLVKLGIRKENVSKVDIEQTDVKTIQTSETNHIDSEEAPDLAHIFTNWDQFSEDINKPSDLWVWDDVDKKIRCNYNASHLSGFISDKAYDIYNLSARCSVKVGESFRDDDLMGIVIAYTEIEGVHHTLVATRSLNPEPDMNEVSADIFKAQWTITYRPTASKQLIVKNKTNSLGVLSQAGNILTWDDVPEGATIEIERVGDVIKARTSEVGTTSVKGYTEIVIDLNNHPELDVFKGASRYGFCCCSQNKSTFDNLNFSTPISISGSVTAKSDKIYYTYTNGTEVTESEVVYTEEVDSEDVVLDSNELIISPLPQQFAPIIIEDMDNGVSLSQLHTLNGDSSMEWIEQKFTLERDTDKITLTYSGVDENTINIIVDNAVIKFKEVINNVITLLNPLNKGDEVVVRYRLANVFTVDYEIENNQIKVKHHNELFENAMVCYEAATDTAFKGVDYLSINPLHKTRYSGFVYIDYNTEDAPIESMEIKVTTDMLYRNSTDSTSVSVEVLDKIGNPMFGKLVNLEVTGGKLTYTVNKTDVNGVVHGYIQGIEDIDKVTITAMCENLADIKEIKTRERVGF